MQNIKYKYASLLCEKNIPQMHPFHVSATFKPTRDGTIIPVGQHSYKRTCSTKLAAGERHCPVLAIGYWR